MKICLLGYGKMGKAIDSLAGKFELEISGRINQQNLDTLESAIREADVVIEFSLPHLAVNHIKKCFDLNKPVVCGTTGWLNQLQEVEHYCGEKNGSLVHASNFSVGVNLFFALNKKLASLMKDYKEYTPQIQEIHHLAKLDSPSGTGISLANDIITRDNRFNEWQLTYTQMDKHILGIESIREGQVPGTHTISYSSDIDDIIITHQAHSRMGFASGAIIAAKWLYGKKGIYTMNDVLGIS